MTKLILYFDSNENIKHQAHPLFKHLPLSLWKYDNEYISTFKYGDDYYNIKYINVTDNLFNEISKIKIDNSYKHIIIPYSLSNTNNIQNYKIRIAISLFLQNLDITNISSINILTDSSIGKLEELFPETDMYVVEDLLHYLGDKLVIVETSIKDIIVEFGSGYKHVFDPVAHYYFDPVYSRLNYDDYFMSKFPETGWKLPIDIITGLKILRNKINTNKYNLYFRSSRMFEHLTLTQLQQVHKLLKDIQFKKLSIIVPDFKYVINEIDDTVKNWWQNKQYHIFNSEVFGFKDWESDTDHKTVWTEKLLSSFVKSLGKYDITITKNYVIDDKRFYLYCDAIRRKK